MAHGIIAWRNIYMIIKNAIRIPIFDDGDYLLTDTVYLFMYPEYNEYTKERYTNRFWNHCDF